MSTITAEQVLRIIDTEISEDDVNDIFIPMADAMLAAAYADVNGVVAPDSLDTQLRLLLAAHLMSVARDPEAGALLESRTDATYSRLAGGTGTKDMFGAGLRQTRFGQQATVMSPELAAIADGKPEARIGVIETSSLVGAEDDSWW